MFESKISGLVPRQKRNENKTLKGIICKSPPKSFFFKQLLTCLKMSCISQLMVFTTMCQNTGRRADTQRLPFSFPPLPPEIYCAGFLFWYLPADIKKINKKKTCFCLLDQIKSGWWQSQIQARVSSAASYLESDSSQCTQTRRPL